MKALLFIIMMLPGLVYAEFFGALATSHHLDDSYDYNSSHLMGGYKGEGWAVTVFDNSYSDTAITVGRYWEFPLAEKISWEVYAGAVVGYGDNLTNVAGVSPYGWAGINYEISDDFRLELKTVGAVSILAGVVYF